MCANPNEFRYLFVSQSETGPGWPIPTLALWMSVCNPAVMRLLVKPSTLSIFQSVQLCGDWCVGPNA